MKFIFASLAVVVIAVGLWGQAKHSGLTGTAGAVIDESAITSAKPFPHVTSNPGTCAVGQKIFNTVTALFYGCLTTNNWTAEVTSGGSYDPLDTSTIYWREEWLSASTSFGLYGQLGWYQLDGGISSSGPIDAATVNNNNHLGVYLMQPNSSANQFGAYQLGQLSTYGIRGLSSLTGWTSKFIFNPKLGSTEMQVRVGFAAGTGEVPTDGIWVRYANSAGCTTNPGTDTKLTFETRSSSTSTTSTTNAPNYTVDHWYAIKIRAVSSGVIGFSVSDDEGAYSTETTISTNVPTAALNPYFEIVDCDGSPKQLWVDFAAGNIPVSRIN